LLSDEPARPFAQNRSGISIGEAAAFALLVPGASARSQLLGVGESSDGFHMSTPHPEGLGAIEAMAQALDRAGLDEGAIDYVNLHGTGTRANDRVESLAVMQAFGRAVACSSTKGATGHCLGAAGAIEALICDLALEHQIVPGNVGIDLSDPELPLKVSLTTTARPLRRALSNSFGFGGSNCTLILGTGHAD
ncbi:MAG: beta-ketoacyl-[acyl-carrier-protein] synthase II, partial [Burkholderiaceae bacterium]